MDRVGWQLIKTVTGWKENEITGSRPSQGGRTCRRESYKKLGTTIATPTGKMEYRTTNNDSKKEVPGLHPGVNDLVRLLGKQAHCSSRTLISCDTSCPRAYSQSKYHKNCASPKQGRSWDSLCRPSSLWSPIPPDSYYYDCFFYRQYPDRDSEYKEIEERYNALKQQKLDYSPPECDQDKIRALISEPTLESKSKMRGNDEQSGSFAGKSGGILDNGTGPGTFRGKDDSSGNDYSSRKGYASGKDNPSGKDLLSSSGKGYQNSSGQDDEYRPSSNKKTLGSGSRRNMVAEGDSVPCSELVEIRDLLRKSDRETIRRMQEMLILMKELSVRDICRARCGGGTIKTNGAAQEQSFMSPGLNERSQKRDDSRRGNEEPDNLNGSYSLKKHNSDDELISAKGSKKSYRQGQESSSPEQGSNMSFRLEGNVFSPQSSKKDYSHDDKGSKREDKDDNYYGDESDTYQTPGKPSQKRKQGAQYGREQQEPTRRAKKKKDDGDSGESDGNYMDTHGDDATGQYAAEPVQYSNRSIKKLQGSSKRTGKDDDYASDSSNSGKEGRPSSRKGKHKGRKGDSGSDTDPTESSSSLSEYSTDGSRNDFRSGEDESDLESSGMEDESSRSLGKQSLTNGKKKTVRKEEFSSSETSVSIKGSTTSMSQSRGPIDYDQDPGASKQAAIPSKYSSANDRLGSGGNFRLTVGKDQLTVHEVVELSNKITDIIVLEMMDELIRKGLYVPPSIRNEPDPVRSDRQTISQKSGGPSTSPTLPKVDQISKAGSKKLSRIDESSPRAGLSKGTLQKPDGSTRDEGKDERKGSQESKKSICPRHSRSLSPSASGRKRSLSCRLELERERARSAGPQYKKPGQPSDPRAPPEPWQRRLSSQMKADSLKESSMQGKPDSFRGSTKDGSQQISASGPIRLDQPSQRASELDPIAESSKWSTAPYKTSHRISDGNRESLGSRVSKTKSDRALDIRLDQSSFRKPDQAGSRTRISGQKQSIQGPDIPEGSIGRIQPYKTATQEQPIPGSHRSSKISKMSNAPPVKRDQVESRIQVPGPKQTIKSNRPDVSEGVLKRIQQYKTITQNRIDNPGSRRSSKIGKMSYVRQSSKNSQLSKTHLERDHSLVGPKNKPRLNIHDEAQPISASGQQIQGINAEPTSVTEKEVSGGRVLSFTRTENVDVFLPDTGSGKALPAGPQLSQIASACEPDDLIAKTYDTDDSILYYARITGNAFPPDKESFHAAGFMLRSAYDYCIPPRGKVSVKTDLLLQVPRNSYGRIAPRKCLVESYGIDVGADIIDRDFKGNLTVVLFNHGDTKFTIKRGNKVAQLICESIHLAKVLENKKLLKE